MEKEKEERIKCITCIKRFEYRCIPMNKAIIIDRYRFCSQYRKSKKRIKMVTNYDDNLHEARVHEPTFSGSED